MKYYKVEFHNDLAVCSRIIATDKNEHGIINFINSQKSIKKSSYNNGYCDFIKMKEVDKKDFENFVNIFEKTEQEKVLKQSII